MNLPPKVAAWKKLRQGRHNARSKFTSKINLAMNAPATTGLASTTTAPKNSQNNADDDSKIETDSSSSSTNSKLPVLVPKPEN